MFVLYLTLFIALLDGQAEAPPLPAQNPLSEPSDHANLSPLEISKLRAKAEAGDSIAQLELGAAYEKGNGVPQNDTLAATWYKRAAEQGNATAQNNLGIMYRFGQGIDKNKEEAARWYRKAAKQGNAEAMFNLGASYYNGDGVAENPTLACAWFLLAQEGGSSVAENAVQRCNAEMGRLAKIDVVLEIGDMYEKGEDLPQSYVEAAKWYRKEAERSPAAAIQLAKLMFSGQGGKQDYGEAMHLCRGAAKNNYSPGQYCVGYLYQHGFGVPADPKEAVKWFREAAVLGHVRAALISAEMYLKGEGVPADRPEAYWLLVLAFNGGAQEAKSRAHLLRQEMSKDENKRTEKKLQEHGFDPKKVFQMIDDPTSPDPAESRRVLSPVIR